MDDRLRALDRTLLLLVDLVSASPTTIAAALGATPVRLVAGAAAASKSSGQAALATLENILVRSGIPIEVDVTPVPVITPVLGEGDLPQRLVAFGNAIVPGSTAHAGPTRPALVIGIGAMRLPDADRKMWLHADGPVGFRPGPTVWAPRDSIDSLGASGMAAGETVRFALRTLAPRSASRAMEIRAIEAAEIELPRRPAVVDVGTVDCISAGAITHSLLWTLWARGSVLGELRLFDDGRYEITNLNRYMLLDWFTATSQILKVDHLAALRIPGLRLEPVARRFGASDLANARHRMVVGADDIAVRHMAQRSDPDWLGIGATSHEEARITEHRRGGPCAGCAHPYVNAPDDAPIPTIAPVSFWAGFALANRLLGATNASPLEDASAYATYWPLRPGTASIGPTQWHPRCPFGHRAA